MKQLPDTAHLHNDRAVLTKTKYAEYAVKNSLVTGGIVIPGKSPGLKQSPAFGLPYTGNLKAGDLIYHSRLAISVLYCRGMARQRES